MSTRNRIIKKICIVGSRSEMKTVNRLVHAFKLLGWVVLDLQSCMEADAFWIVLPDAGQAITSQTKSFVNSVSDQMMKFHNETNGVLVSTGDINPVRGLPPWAMGSKGIMCSRTHDDVIRLIVDRVGAMKKTGVPE